MKKIILSAASVLLIINIVSAQGGFLGGLSNNQSGAKNVVPVPKPELSYEIHGSYERPVTKTQLDKAKQLSDFINGYPTNWIEDYSIVELKAINSGKEMKAVNTNEKLTVEQQKILKSADLNSDVDIMVKYKAAKTLSSLGENTNVDNPVKTMNIRMTVVPETVAKYASGAKEMDAYIKENVINKIPETVVEKITSAKVLFTITTKGEIDEVILLKPSGNATTDQLMIDAIKKMPNWKPASNAKGEKVKQNFEFIMGVFGC